MSVFDRVDALLRQQEQKKPLQEQPKPIEQALKEALKQEPKKRGRPKKGE